MNVISQEFRPSLLIGLSVGQAFWLLLLITTLLRLAASWMFLGFLTGDDVEIVETAFASALGLEYQPWQIRNLLLPEVVVAPVLRTSALFGVTEPATMVRMGLVPFVLAGSLATWLVYRLGRLLSGRPSVALLAAAIFSFHPLIIAFSSSAYPRIVSSVAILLGAWILSNPERDVVRGLLAGSLLALAIAFRFSEVIYAAPILVLAWHRCATLRLFLVRTASLGVGLVLTVALAVGWFDWLTWGSPFASVENFARFTLLERQSSSLEAHQPLLWYLRRLPHWIPVTLLPFVALSWRERSLRWMWSFLLLPLLVLSAIHHKELRYLQGMIPFLALLSALGAAHLWNRGWRRAVAILLIISSLYGAERGLRTLERKSMAAVEAARDLAGQTRGVAFSQVWAYGDRLLLGNDVVVEDLSMPPQADKIKNLAPDVDAVGLYTEQLEGNPALHTALQEAGFELTKSYRWGRSKGVELFRRRKTSTSTSSSSTGPACDDLGQSTDEFGQRSADAR